MRGDLGNQFVWKLDSHGQYLSLSVIYQLLSAWLGYLQCTRDDIKCWKFSIIYVRCFPLSIWLVTMTWAFTILFIVRADGRINYHYTLNGHDQQNTSTCLEISVSLSIYQISPCNDKDHSIFFMSSKLCPKDTSSLLSLLLLWRPIFYWISHWAGFCVGFLSL